MDYQLVWVKKGFNYVLRVSDGYKFVKGWRKLRLKQSRMKEQKNDERSR